VFCSATCRSRARTRANQAARLLELADVVETRVGNPVFGSVAYLRARALRGFGKMPPRWCAGFPTRPRQ
jgi:hypothetical protein